MYYITVSNGLLKDGHPEKMGSAVWTFMWLLDKMTSCDEEGMGKILGGKPIKSTEISKDLNLTPRTIRRHISELEKSAYIKTLRTPYGLIFTVNKAKKIFQKRADKNDHQSAKSGQKLPSIEIGQKLPNKEDNTAIDKTVRDKTTPAKSGSGDGIKQIIEEYYLLKGWKYENTIPQQKLWRRNLRPAKELLELCEKNLDEAKYCLRKVGEWAKSKELDWSIETVFKKWYDIDSLKPKEKKPYFEGKRIFQKVPNGKWWCIYPDGEIKELGIWPKESLIVWK